MKPEMLKWEESQTIKKLVDALALGQLLIGSTDTVLGLFAPTTATGFKLLNQVKQRFKKPYLILVSSPDRISHYVNIKESFHIENIVKRFWPGPLTIILRAKSDLPTYLKSEDGTIALRMPNHKHIRTLLEQAGDLFSTSANIAGEPIPEELDQVSHEILKRAAYAVLGRAGQVLPSTIIDCSNPSTVKIVREGAISAKELGL